MTQTLIEKFHADHVNWIPNPNICYCDKCGLWSRATAKGNIIDCSVYGKIDKTNNQCKFKKYLD